MSVANDIPSLKASIMECWANIGSLFIMPLEYETEIIHLGENCTLTYCKSFPIREKNILACIWGLCYILPEVGRRIFQIKTCYYVYN